MIYVSDRHFNFSFKWIVVLMSLLLLFRNRSLNKPLEHTEQSVHA